MSGLEKDFGVILTDSWFELISLMGLFSLKTVFISAAEAITGEITGDEKIRIPDTAAGNRNKEAK